MVDAGKLLLVMISYGYVVDDDDVVANWFWFDFVWVGWFSYVPKYETDQRVNWFTEYLVILATEQACLAGDDVLVQVVVIAVVVQLTWGSSSM